MRRILRYGIWGVVILLFLFLLAAAVKFVLLERSGAKTVLSAPASCSVEKPRLGEVFYLKGEIKVPWNRFVPESTVPDLPEKLQSPGEGKLLFRGVGWGYTLWEALLPLQGYESGRTKEGVSWSLVRKGEKILLSSPPVTIGKFPLQDSLLAMASYYTPPVEKPLYLYITAGAALLLLIVILIVWLTRKKAPVCCHIPPWEEARNAISILVEEVRTGRRKREKAITFLSDILSSYIEKRFSIRSTHLTSGEFLHELEKNSSILQESQQHFLRKFLEKTELVKFAALPAGDELWEQAAKDAGNFIEETRIQPEREEKKK